MTADTHCTSLDLLDAHHVPIGLHDVDLAHVAQRNALCSRRRDADAAANLAMSVFRIHVEPGRLKEGLDAPRQLGPLSVKKVDENGPLGRPAAAVPRKGDEALRHRANGRALSNGGERLGGKDGRVSVPPLNGNLVVAVGLEGDSENAEPLDRLELAVDHDGARGRLHASEDFVEFAAVCGEPLRLRVTLEIHVQGPVLVQLAHGLSDALRIGEGLFGYGGSYGSSCGCGCGNGSRSSSFCVCGSGCSCGCDCFCFCFFCFLVQVLVRRRLFGVYLGPNRRSPVLGVLILIRILIPPQFILLLPLLLRVRAHNSARECEITDGTAPKLIAVGRGGGSKEFDHGIHGLQLFPRLSGLFILLCLDFFSSGINVHTGCVVAKVTSDSRVQYNGRIKALPCPPVVGYETRETLLDDKHIIGFHDRLALGVDADEPFLKVFSHHGEAFLGRKGGLGHNEARFGRRSKADNHIQNSRLGRRIVALLDAVKEQFSGIRWRCSSGRRCRRRPFQYLHVPLLENGQGHLVVRVALVDANEIHPRVPLGQGPKGRRLGRVGRGQHDLGAVNVPRQNV